MQQNATNDILAEPKYANMFYLRFIGLKYATIAHKVGLTEQYVRRLFMRGGKLHEPYADFKKLAVGDSVEEAMDMAYANMPDVMRANISDAKRVGSMVAVASRKILFDHTLPKQKQDIDLNVNFTTTDLVRRVTERRKQELNDGTGTGSNSEGVAE